MYTQNDLTNKQLTTDEKKLLKKYNDWMNTQQSCMCNICKQMELYYTCPEFRYIFDKKYNPRGNLNNYQEYNFNHYCCYIGN